MNSFQSPFRHSTLSVERVRLWVISLISIILLSACASSPESLAHTQDPYEKFNRSMFEVNKHIDKVLLKPVAQSYEAAVPLPLRVGVLNVLNNAGDLMIGVNNGLQAKPKSAFSDLARIAINSTLGVFGLFDVASQMGLEKHNEDYGQTFGVWGMEPGNFIYLPILGPLSTRDGIGSLLGMSLLLDNYLIKSLEERMAINLARVVNARVRFFSTEKLLKQAATDEYVFIRNSYLQNRQGLVYDGNPPRPKYDDFEEFED